MLLIILMYVCIFYESFRWGKKNFRHSVLDYDLRVALEIIYTAAILFMNIAIKLVKYTQ